MILNPHTGRSFDLDRMLDCIEDWTSQKPIQKALIKSGTADAKGLIKLALSVRLANENKRGGLTEVQAASVLMQMLAVRKVRREIARYVAGQHGLTAWEVTRDLYAMLEDMSNRIPEETTH